MTAAVFVPSSMLLRQQESAQRVEIDVAVQEWQEWQELLAAMRRQNAYASNIGKARKLARSMYLLVDHPCGIPVYVGILENATGREVLDWWRSQGGN